MSKYLWLVFAFLTACENVADVGSAPSVIYKIETSRISVSGVSSGGYMAGQLHIAHSAIFSGAAIIAAGPNYCAMGDLSRALGPCMQGSGIIVEGLLDYLQGAAIAETIDDLANLKDDRVWLFHGTLDQIVNQASITAAADLYVRLISDDAVTLVTNINVVHGMPTLASGPGCDLMDDPYLNACDYDAAGEILHTLHGELNERTKTRGELTTVGQPGFEAADMLPQAYLYVPKSCTADTACGIHVALHGCSQSSEFVDDAFVVGAGYNEWADANKLLVLYPQVARSKIAPMNPYGCWDWWGYSGINYANKEGPQLRVIKATLDSLAGMTL